MMILISIVLVTFMSKNTPTILLEAGHHPNDFGRNIVVHEIHKSLLMFLNLFVRENEIKSNTETYFSIPKNYDHLRDIEVVNIRCLSGLSNKRFVQFREILKETKSIFLQLLKTIALKNFMVT